MIGKIIMLILIVVAILSICLGSVIVFDAGKSTVLAVSTVSIAASEYLENIINYFVNTKRIYELFYFGITWLALAYLGLKIKRR